MKSYWTYSCLKPRKFYMRPPLSDYVKYVKLQFEAEIEFI